MASVLLFYLTAVVVVVATVLAVSRSNAVHGLLYLVVALLGTALTFFLLGAPFAAALEVIIYAGAIMVLFLFAVMMLDLRAESVQRERTLLRPRRWLGPALLAGALLALLIAVMVQPVPPGLAGSTVGPRLVSRGLFGPYMLGVEIASVLLLAGLVVAYHLSRALPGQRGPEAAT